MVVAQKERNAINRSEPGKAASKTQALASLVAGDNLTVAAQRAGTTRQTIKRWIDNDEQFARALQKHRDVILERISTKILNASTESVDYLLALVLDKNEPTNERRQAAQFLLDAGRDAATLHRISRKVMLLQERIGGQQR